MNKIYENAGMQKTKVLEPRYWWTDGHERLPRHKVSRHSAHSLEGLVKIWSCDNIVYEYKKGVQMDALDS
jgi:hypothetical protein